MKELVLHIGRHKSGTTAIQRFLRQNSDFLARHGFYYPSTGIRGFAHHLISEPMQNVAQRQNRSKTPSDLPLLAPLSEEIATTAAQKIILSSEAFQNCAPEFVADVFNTYQVRVVVYIRNQLDYLTSAYAQRVHGTEYTGSLADYFKTIYSVDYFDFLNSWQQHFPSAFTVRKFDRSALVDGDVVADFIAHGLAQSANGDTDFIVEEEANPSLNEKVVQLKLYLNREGYYHSGARKYLYRLLPQLNDEFPADTVRASESIKTKLLRRCLKSDAATAKRYFKQAQLFDYSHYRTAEATVLKAQELSAMLAAVDERLATAGQSLQSLRQLTN